MIKRLCTILVPVLLATMPLWSQTNKGSISGTIFDPSGAVLPGVTVTIINIGTGHKIVVQTTERGAFTVTNLDPVDYRIEADVPGFKKTAIERVKVDTATAVTVNLTMEIGTRSDVVQVTATVPLLNAESGAVAQTISERQLTDLPLNNRSALDLAMTIANVAGDAGSEDPDLASTIATPGFNLFVNGGRAGSSNILADGARNTGVGLARAVVTFSPDSVQEFTVVSSNFSAEYGQSGGGIINITTKSGTNQFHGNLNWYNRNPVFQAGTYTTSPTVRPKRNLRQNQFGAIFQGPVYLPKIFDGRNRTFFFVSFEPRYYSDSTPYEPLLPTEGMRRGDFSNLVNVSGAQAPRDVVAQFPGLTYTDVVIYNQFLLQEDKYLRPQTMPAGTTTFPQFPNNVMPTSMLDPVALKIQEMIPPAGEYFISSSNTLANYSTTNFIKNEEFRLTTKIDHQLTQSNRLSGRYTQVPIRGDKGCCDFEIGVNEINTGGTDYSSSKQLLITDTHTWPRMINELRLNYTRGRFSRNMPPMYDIYTGKNWSTELGLPSITVGGLPSFAMGAYYMGFSQSQQNENLEQTYNVADNFSWIRGNMSWKFGVDLADMRLKTAPMYGGPGGRYEFNRNTSWTNSALTGATGGAHYAQFLLGVPNLVTLRDSLFTYYYRWRSIAAFVQNDWKVTPALTLNLGLRYTLQYPREEENNLQAAYRPDLAKEYPLAAPVTLANGHVVTKALVPPLAFSGYGGRSKYLTPVDYNGWEPRFGFAWVPRLFGWNDAGKFVIRGGYGLSHGTLTGMDRNANPDFSGTTGFNGDTGGVDASIVNVGGVNYNTMMRLCCNKPNLVPKTPQERLQIPEDGLLYLDSINYAGGARAISGNFHVPYVQSFSMQIQYELSAQNVLEAGYAGSKGTHLFMPPINLAPRSYDVAESFFRLGVSPDAQINDPLGRRQPNGSLVRINQGDAEGEYMGFAALNAYLDSSSNSIRHGAYVSLRRRMSRGLMFTTNYTFAKSIDDASDSGGVRFVDFNIIRSNGQVMAGAPRSNDRSVSTFDVRHAFSGTFLWDLPVGKGRYFLPDVSGWMDQIIGGWTFSGSGRIQQGTPLVIVIRDGNQLAAGNLRAIRPNLVPGVPIMNPLWSRDCPIGTTCEPWFNPAAFTRPVKGEIGNAPRTIDSARWPTFYLFDFSVQKNWQLREGRRLQLRVDAINLFNHPIFQFGRDSDNGEIFTTPSENTISNSEYDAWANYSPSTRPPRNTPAGAALLAQINLMIRSYNTNPAGQAAAMVLPRDFFVTPVPQGFHSVNLNSFDITKVEDLKLYRLKQAYTPDRWGYLAVTRGAGSLAAPYTPRFLQFALKLFF
ncbi:MAG: Cna domain protein [Acidobacteria bacterium]|nr:Cna domain protein [Acidobacteriota bacterium]